MTPNQSHETLQRDGYFTAPAILDNEQVSRLRDVCEERWQRNQSPYINAVEFLASPMATVPFQPETVAALRAALGNDYVTIPEYVVQTDRFGGWHRDAGNQGHVPYVFRPGWTQVQCAVYLQDNDPVYGGGLDVKPGGHRELIRIGSPTNPLRQALRHATFKLGRTLSIPSKAGDLLGFHFRLFHRATPQTKPRRKFAIFWVAAANGPDVERYMEHFRRFYKDQPPIPLSDYPASARALIAQQSLNVAI